MMMRTSSATSLVALDAIAVDSETTGLDPAKARVVELGAVRLLRGRLELDEPFRRLIQPGEPIAKAASDIHRIDDTMVSTAPRFAEVWPDFVAFADGNVLIGHTLGFDLAVFRNECRRAGLTFFQPLILDTRLLAQAAEPNLAAFTLESLASWLGVDVTERHSAVGDAVTAARVFVALVPRLRAVGIRTLGEAIQACRAQTETLHQQHRAGWADPFEIPASIDAEQALGRVDTYPFRHHVRDVMRSPAKFVDAVAPVSEALSRLVDERISSLYVRSAEGAGGPLRATECGIVTERDILRGVEKYGADVLAAPVARLMSKPLAAIPEDAFVYRAIARMNRLGVRHLGVVDEDDRVVGALTTRDLLRLRANEAISLGDEIDEASDVHALAAAWAKLPHAAAALLTEAVSARDIAAVISSELCSFTRQSAIIAERLMREGGHGAPPCAYALAVLGSAGRGESLLAMDQDNALVFAEGAPGSSSDLWFQQLGSHIADVLHEVGVPYCKGGIMARNPQWRGSLATWRERIEHWIHRSRPEDLLAVDIFFDMRPVHGDGRLCTKLWSDAFDAARGDIGFAKLLAEAAGEVESALGIFGRFKTTGGRIDLKKCGLFGIVSMARVLAVRHHVVERSTAARLTGIKALRAGAERDLEALIEAQDTFLALLTAQQVEDIEGGIAPSNAISVGRLSSRARDELRAAFEAVRVLPTLTSDLLFVS